MDFSSSSKLAARLVVLDRIGSTNDELARRLQRDPVADWPEYSVLITDDQTSGKGRLGRQWAAPAGTMLAVSVVLRPALHGIAPESFGWIPLVAGLSMASAMSELGTDAELKWPNDVLVGGRKVCGILAEVETTGAIILGSGINLTLTEEQLPVPTATSMLIERGQTDADVVLSAYLSRLVRWYGSFADARGDAVASGLQAATEQACSTLGRAVRVQLPDGSELTGVATGLDATGRLVVRADGRLTAVAAGDVTHLRY